ncbi:MAG: hypothetical protein OHK0039_20270 [Bacteroidia bacterium]
MLTSIIPRLPARNLDETEHFYQHMLGFETLNRYENENYLILGLGDLELHFYGHPNLDPARSDVMLYVRVSEGLDELFGAVHAKGARFPAGAHVVDQPWGQREFAITDPNGGLLTFGQPV